MNKANGELPDSSKLPKKCYKCGVCQKFEPSDNDDEICQICNDDEGEHEQVISILTFQFI
jgi:hypothetical protein